MTDPAAATDWEALSHRLYGTANYADWLRGNHRDERAAQDGLCQCCIHILDSPGGQPRVTKATTAYVTHHGYRVLLCDPCRDIWVAQEAPGSAYAPQSVLAL